MVDPPTFRSVKVVIFDTPFIKLYQNITFILLKNRVGLGF